MRSPCLQPAALCAALLPSLLLLCAATGVHAQPQDGAGDTTTQSDAADEPLDIYAPVPAERRSDFVVGTNLGLMLGNAIGFPDDFDAVGVSELEVDTGAVATFGNNLWIGGALQDWFTFGLGGAVVALSGNGLDASGGAFIVRIEVFPLYTLGGAFRDLGIASNFGLGGITIERNGKERAAGSGLSVVGAGLFWEALRFGGFAFGPSGEYTYMTTRNLTAHTALLGLRIAWYAGP